MTKENSLVYGQGFKVDNPYGVMRIKVSPLKRDYEDSLIF